MRTEGLSTEDLAAPAPESPETPEPAEEVELFEHEKVEAFLDRWRALQTAFVDDPREAVHDADQLVAEVIQTLATTFAEHKRNLETQWQQGESVATEDLRLALRRYRTFFNELLRTN
ncbi:hypothetical protein FPZ12_036850 [Amycolatopsis acidicola]|uniref:Uncharacterized protein n=1 Tax=Amycolatopsis acidicola TaxID=2596893 RepID=A0A5N0UT89_9PSEU|nr:hypothetical protein [Amycolatopsis acidicola]KAA9152490.1 hypothetical protein FPZ12_036850 [Amycolatopsis acidicola]